MKHFMHFASICKPGRGCCRSSVAKECHDSRLLVAVSVCRGDQGARLEPFHGGHVLRQLFGQIAHLLATLQQHLVRRRMLDAFDFDGQALTDHIEGSVEGTVGELFKAMFECPLLLNVLRRAEGAPPIHKRPTTEARASKNSDARVFCRQHTSSLVQLVERSSLRGRKLLISEVWSLLEKKYPLASLSTLSSCDGTSATRADDDDVHIEHGVLRDASVDHLEDMFALQTQSGRLCLNLVVRSSPWEVYDLPIRVSLLTGRSIDGSRVGFDADEALQEDENLPLRPQHGCPKSIQNLLPSLNRKVRECCRDSSESEHTEPRTECRKKNRKGLLHIHWQVLPYGLLHGLGDAHRGAGAGREAPEGALAAGIRALFGLLLPD
mmetsp:Transcript_79239/g.164468  ORF Transcript_79239/g.164468 Transcript_79239/m.164468 type:complete len:379 (-) Transcript_79239:278-1414(-)